MSPTLIHHQRLDIFVVILPREDIFAPLSPTMAPEDARDFSDYNQIVANADVGRRSVDNPQYYNQSEELGRHPSY